MRLQRSLCSLLLCAVICFGLFSVSAFAAEFKYPLIPENDFQYAIIIGKNLFLSNEKSYINEGMAAGSDNLRVSFSDKYKLSDDNKAWILLSSSAGVSSTYYHPSKVVYDSTGVFASNSLDVFDIPRPITGDHFQAVTDALMAQFSIVHLVNILVAVVGVGVGFVFMWWGVRKISGGLIAAFKKSKLRL